MRNMFASLAVAGLLVAGGCQSPNLDITGTESAFEHPAADDVITLANDQVYLAISPQLGRVVAFGPTGGDNLLWVADEEQRNPGKRGWSNYGGDKVWPSPQGDWPKSHGRSWPPTPGIDGPAWSLINQTGNTITLQSPISPVLGVQVTRVITLSSDSPKVTIHNTVKRVAPSDHRVHVWTVTQINMPDYCLINFIASQADGVNDLTYFSSKPKPATVAAANKVDSDVYRYDMPDKGGHKIGSYGTWCAGVFPNLIFAQSIAPITQAEADKKNYPDSSNVQIYNDQRYVELEMLSNANELQVGEQLELTVHWWLLVRPPAESPAQLAALIESAID